MKIFKKLLPSSQAEKPFHAGEIYYLWEGITSAYKLVETLETYLMNTEDTELHTLLNGILKATYQFRIKRLENVIKEQGFSVPPRPATKVYQGKPGAGQEVKLSDDEVILNLVYWGQSFLMNDARAAGAITRESIRKIYTDLIFDDIKAYNIVLDFAINRNVFNPPPPASAKDNGLNMEEVGLLWTILSFRHLSIINLETYLVNTNDRELASLLKRGINQIALPQLEETENALKQEGFTVPPRPVRREVQAPPGQVNKIKLSDVEIISALTAAAQFLILQHVRGFYSSRRKDIRNLFVNFLSTEIEEYQKIIDLASKRHALSNPPVVSSQSG